MQIEALQERDWAQVKQIYLEAFPKAEQKPFSSLKRGVKKGKLEIYAAKEGDMLLGFAVVIPYGDQVMVDYLAVNQRLRSRGTGSRILQQVCRRFSDKAVVLLIEELDEQAANHAQRVARRKFYLKNGFRSADLHPQINGSAMEVLVWGKSVTRQGYLNLQKHALGTLFYHLARIRLGT